MRISVVCLMFVFITTLLISSTTFIHAQVYVSQDFTDAIDTAVQLMLQDKSFTSKYEDLMSLPVPLCGSTVSFPANNPFVGKTNLTMCFEDDAVYPYSSVFHMVGQKIIEKINANYKINLGYAYKTYNLAALGFFETMVKAVNEGSCDVVTSNVAFNSVRETRAHFQCRYGYSSPAFIRTDLSPSIVANQVQDLNRTDVKVGFLKGTIYQTTVETQLSGSQLVPYGDYVTLYGAVSSSLIHAAVGDGIEFKQWLKENNNTSCRNCTAKLFSNPYFFGTITTKNIGRANLGHSLFQSTQSSYMTILSLFSILFLWISLM